jgi:large subunit ribosomal protein L6
MVSVRGPKGELKLRLVPEIEAAVKDETIEVTTRQDDDRARAMWGMQRTLINNLVLGVTQGFSERLEISGVGYRAAVQGRNLQLQVGLSHDVSYPIPTGIQIVCEKPTSIAISGSDKQLVGQVAAEIRSYRPPEPYKGKGVRYASERIRRKEGKKK